MRSTPQRIVTSAVQLFKSGFVTVPKGRATDHRPCESVTAGQLFAVGDRHSDHSGEENLIGQTVDERYQVIDIIGRGGQGVVYRVRHSKLSRVFAMKVLRYREARTPEMSERMLREARALASVRSSHVIDVHGFGVLPDGSTYLLMELLDGISLRHALDTRAIGSLADVLQVATEIALGLDAAHRMGVIHRDLKPENVYLCREGLRRRVKIIDFGLAKVASEQSYVTVMGATFGTPHYMSPEQALGDAVGTSTDVYSFGVLLFELVTNRLPFRAPSMKALLGKLLNEAPPRLEPASPLSKPVIRELEHLVHRCLEKAPGGRPRNFEVILQELNHVALLARTEATGSAPGPKVYRIVRVGALACLLLLALLVVGGQASSRKPAAPALAAARSVELQAARPAEIQITPGEPAPPLPTASAGEAPTVTGAGSASAAKVVSTARPPLANPVRATPTASRHPAIGGREIVNVWAAAIPPSPAECLAADECKKEGRCTLRAQKCVATTDDQCRVSNACVIRGRCTAVGGRCVARSEADCEASRACLQEGRCGLVNDLCQVSSNTHCRNSANCRAFGTCTWQGDGCLSSLDADCRNSALCSNGGLCFSRDGACRAAVDQDCRKSFACSQRGACYENAGTCGAFADEDCASSDECSQLGRCVARHGVCVVPL